VSKIYFDLHGEEVLSSLKLRSRQTLLDECKIHPRTSHEEG